MFYNIDFTFFTNNRYTNNIQQLFYYNLYFKIVLSKF
jgi:hypothetical protein